MRFGEYIQFQGQKYSSTWDTNNGAFMTTKMAAIKGLLSHEFINNRGIDLTDFHINPNKKQKYKVSFRLNFLIENKFDFLLSSVIILWQGI